MKSIMKDIGTGLYAGLAVILNLIPTHISEILLFLSLVLGVTLLIMRIYSRYLYIKKQKREK